MYKRHRNITELRDTRVKTTFKVEIILDLPYLDNREYVDMRLSEAIEEILSKVNKGKTDGHFEKEDYCMMNHKTQVSYGYDEEEEYNIYDYDI